MFSILHTKIWMALIGNTFAILRPWVWATVHMKVHARLIQQPVHSRDFHLAPNLRSTCKPSFSLRRLIIKSVESFRNHYFCEQLEKVSKTSLLSNFKKLSLPCFLNKEHLEFLMMIWQFVLTYLASWREMGRMFRMNNCSYELLHPLVFDSSPLMHISSERVC